MQSDKIVNHAIQSFRCEKTCTGATLMPHLPADTRQSRGKTRVHNMANKKIKCNLQMASLTAVKLDKDLKTYYERKVAEGKNEMSVLNAVKNKLLARVVSCVNNQREYVNKAA